MEQDSGAKGGHLVSAAIWILALEEKLKLSPVCSPVTELLASWVSGSDGQSSSLFTPTATSNQHKEVGWTSCGLVLCYIGGAQSFVQALFSSCVLE